MCPLATTQRSAELWLQRYFEVNGDALPHKDLVLVIANLSKEVYGRYKKDKMQNRLKVVAESKFNELWRILYPKHKKRPHCDIAGSCDTCFHIDRLRRQEHDRATELMLHEAHFLHRGGMFMVERGE
jgi:hypothetical protein